MSALSAAAAITPSRGTRPPMVSTSTWERSLVVPSLTELSITSRARSRTSAAVYLRFRSWIAPIAPASVPSCSFSSFRISALSRCTWPSTKAGSSSFSEQSSTWGTPAATPGPIRAIRSPSTTTSATYPSGSRTACKAHTGGYHSAGTPATGAGAQIRGKRHGRGNWRARARRRLSRRPPAVAADDLDGPAARDGHVRRHSAGATHPGVQPEHRHLLQRRGDAHLPRRHRFQGTELSWLELFVHRFGACRAGHLRQPRPRVRRHRHGRRHLPRDRGDRPFRRRQPDP